MEWYLKNKNNMVDIEAVSKKFGIDPVIARIMANRDISSEEDIRQYLYGSISELPDVWLMPGIEKCCRLLIDGIKKHKRIRVIGDYDVDGVCSTYILTKGLRDMGAIVDYRIPDRVNDGYGINARLVKAAVADGTDILITCDNGISAAKELAYAKGAGLIVIVTDHHSVPVDENGRNVLPPADTIVYSKLPGSRYPETPICGAATALKVIQALSEKIGMPHDYYLQFLEFAAISTVCDVMPLIGENRIIIKEGLKKIAAGGHNKGLRCLINTLQIQKQDISTYHIGFMIGPCINAAGRLENAAQVLRLFFSKNDEQMVRISEHLRELNEERKALTQKGYEKAEKIVREHYMDDKVLIVYVKGLHESLAGIVAGRLREAFGKPAFVLTESRGGIKGSGRSTVKYHMYDALCKAGHLLKRFGGHPMAAGLSLDEENIDSLRKCLNEVDIDTSDDDRLWIDAPLPVGSVSASLIHQLELLAPFGEGNEKPVFGQNNVCARNLKVLGRSHNALSMTICDTDGASVPAIMFGKAEELMKQIEGCDRLSIAYYPQIDTFGGRRKLQLEVSNIKAS